MEATQDSPLSSQPSHLKHWMRETASFLEIYNREAALIGLLRDEKASLMAEREQLVEALKRGEEKHKVALRLLCQDKDNVAKELQEKLRKVGEQMEGNMREMTKEKETLAEKLLQSNSENAKLHAKLKSVVGTVKTYKTFHEQLNSAFQNVTY